MPDLMQGRNLNQPRDLAMPSTQPERVQVEETSAEVLTGGSLAEAICGIGAIVLAIVGLAGVLPIHLGAIAAIVVGGGLLLGEIAGPHLPMAELGSGMTAEFLAGAASVVLGNLALIGIVPVTLLCVTAIVLGGALLLGAGASASLNCLVVEHHYRGHVVAQRVAGAMVSGATGAQVLVGLGAIILGILGLAGGYALTLSLVAFLVVGAAVTISGLALSTKMLEMVRR